jgi:hypothetical protein
MHHLSELLRCHDGSQAWIFGKGPSLDVFDARGAGRLRICINESLLRVEVPTYFFAHDERPISHVAEHWQSGCKAILEPDRANFAAHKGIPPDDIYVYRKCEQDFNVLHLTPEEIAKSGQLLSLSGTVHSAIHFCRLVGAAALVFVGIEGRGGYANSLGLELPPGGGQHSRIRRDAIRVLEALEMPYEFNDSPIP